MALKFGSGNTTRKLKLVHNDPLFGPRLGEYTHFVLCQLFNKGVDTYVWGYGHWGQTQSLTAYITSGSGGNNTGNMVTVSSTDSGTAGANGFSGHPETDLVLYAIRGQGGYPDLGSPKSIQYTSTIVIGGQASGVPDLRQSPEVYGNAWAWPDNRITPVSDIPFYLGGDDDYYGDRKLCGYMHMAGSINRYLTDEELRGIVTGRIAVLDSFRPDIRELWDFSIDTDAALTGLVGGRALEKIGSGWAWEDTEYRRPASRLLRTSVDVSIGVMTPFTRGWGIGEVSGGGSDILNTTPAALTLTPVKTSLTSASVIAATPAPLTLVGAKSSLVTTTVVNGTPATLTLTASKAGLAGSSVTGATPAGLSLTPVVAGIISSGASVIAATPAALTLAASKAGLAGSNVVNATPATLTLTASKADLAGGDVVNAAPASLSLAASKAGIASSGAVNCTPALLTITPSLASVVTLSAGVINTTPATLTLVTAKAGLAGKDVVLASPASLAISPAKTSLQSTEITSTVAVSMVITPATASIVTSSVGVLDTSPASLTLAAKPAGFSEDGTVRAVPATLTLQPALAAVVSYSITPARPATLTLKGFKATVDDRPDPVSGVRLQVTGRRISLKVA